ncbi:reverse transcriptase domain-containing protein [Tanacetum coccineum]
MAEEDEDKIAFIAGEGLYCYRKMPFGLKNAGATYQRLIDKVFNDQIGRNLGAYVDDMVIKSTSEEDMLADIKETFQRSLPFFKVLRSYTDKKNIQWTQEAQQFSKKYEICGDFQRSQRHYNREVSNRYISAALTESIILYSRKGKNDSSDGSGTGLMLIDPEGKEYTYALRFKFKAMNNKAEYEALLARLRIA